MIKVILRLLRDAPDRQLNRRELAALLGRTENAVNPTLRKAARLGQLEYDEATGRIVWLSDTRQDRRPRLRVVPAPPGSTPHARGRLDAETERRRDTAREARMMAAKVQTYQARLEALRTAVIDARRRGERMTEVALIEEGRILIRDLSPAERAALRGL
jgi:hypothetical protein